MYVKQICSKRRISAKQCQLGKSYPHPPAVDSQVHKMVQNGGFVAGSAPKRPHHPTATDLVGMKDPDNKPD